MKSEHFSELDHLRLNLQSHDRPRSSLRVRRETDWVCVRLFQHPQTGVITSISRMDSFRCRCDLTRLSWIRCSPGGPLATAPLTGVITGVFSSTTQLSGRPDGLEYSDAGLGEVELTAEPDRPLVNKTIMADPLWFAKEMPTNWSQAYGVKRSHCIEGGRGGLGWRGVRGQRQNVHLENLPWNGEGGREECEETKREVYLESQICGTQTAEGGRREKDRQSRGREREGRRTRAGSSCCTAVKGGAGFLFRHRLDSVQRGGRLVQKTLDISPLQDLIVFLSFSELHVDFRSPSP
ncbi:hypothetical protein INR49_015434 [Caranx melampygus]|nr:hypothetical protein INR49_015434 [Caranx melampygus]